jgi:hypothetical protein
MFGDYDAHSIEENPYVILYTHFIENQRITPHIGAKNNLASILLLRRVMFLLFTCDRSTSDYFCPN